MRKVNGIESVSKLVFDMATSEERTECNRQAGAAVKKTVAAKLETLALQGTVKITEHGTRRIYEAALMVGTESEFHGVINKAYEHGASYGDRHGYSRGSAAGRAMGYHEGVAAMTEAVRSLSRWQRIRWAFSSQHKKG